MVIDYLVEAAVITGNSEDEKYYSLLRSDVRDAFNREFYNEEDNILQRLLVVRSG